MSFVNIKYNNRLYYIPLTTYNTLSASNIKASFNTNSLSAESGREGVLKDLASIKLQSQFSLTNGGTLNNSIDEQIALKKRDIEALKPKGLLLNLIFLCFSFLFKDINTQITDLETQTKNLRQKKIKVLEGIQKDQENVSQAEHHIQAIASTHLVARSRARPNGGRARPNGHVLPYRSITQERHLQEQTRTTLQAASKFISACKTEAVKTNLQRTLSPFLTQSAQNIVNEAWSQKAGIWFSRHEQDFQIQEQSSEIDLEDNNDLTYTATLKTRYSVIDPKKNELFQLNSTLTAYIDKNGLIDGGGIENVVEGTIPRPVGYNPRTPPVSIVTKNYWLPALDATSSYCEKSLSVNGQEISFQIAKNFQADCYRRIHSLQIIGVDTLADRYQSLERAKREANQAYQEAIKSQDETRISQTQNRDEQAATAYEQAIVKDLLTLICNRLGDSRRHLIPQITYLFDVNSAFPLQQVITAKYKDFPVKKRIEAEAVHYTITLDIPEDLNKPIRIICNGQGKINRYNITAKGTYSLFPDKHVEFEGTLT